jgi:myosin heavy subunit
MNILHFTPEERELILQIVAGVLHFGNVKFKVEKIANAEDGACIANPEVADWAAELFGCDPGEMAQFLTHRNIGTMFPLLDTLY